jgi:hypothetical protein
LVEARSHRMQWRSVLRWTVVTMLSLFATLAVVLLLGYQLLPIRHLHWSGLSVGLQQLRLAELSFQAGQEEQWWDIQLSKVEVGWRGWPVPFFKAQQLQLAPVLNDTDPVIAGTPDIAEAPIVLPQQQSTSVAGFTLPLLPTVNIPSWLPLSNAIGHFTLQLPCQTTSQQQCQLEGALFTSSQAEQHLIDLSLHGDGQKVELKLNVVEKDQKIDVMNIRQLGIALDVKALAKAGWIEGLPVGLVPENIQLQLTGSWQADQLKLELLQPFTVDFSYQTADLHIPSATLQIQTGQIDCIEARWQHCQLQLDANAALQKLQHPLFKAADWQWHTKAVGQLDSLKLTGIVQNEQALKVNYQATLSPSAVTLNWQLAELYFLAGNPLQVTTLWPELLEVQRGKIAADGQLQLQLPAGQLNTVRVSAQLKELYGIYDRTTFGGLSTQVLLEGDRHAFTMQLPELQLKQLDHGFQTGPAQISGQYRAKWAAPANGDVKLQQAQIDIFGGRLALADTQFNLQQPEIEFKVAVQKIQLSELLKQHPSGQMGGDGVLSGTIPLQFQQFKTLASAKSNSVQPSTSQPSSAPKSSVNSSVTAKAIAQWQVLGGSLSAEAPGGRLQYQYQPVAGKEPAGMDLAWQALSDFRYQTLATTVELQPNGKVLLQVKLHGYNPDLQQGRPIHFNINVEEDLPALLTSLQLSGQISDRVRQRIQQKIQQQQAAKSAPVKPQ